MKSHPGVALIKAESWTQKQAPKPSVKVGEWLSPLLIDTRKAEHTIPSQECEKGKTWLENCREESEEYRAISCVGPQKYKAEEHPCEEKEEGQRESVRLWLAAPTSLAFYKIISLLYQQS